MVRLWGKFPWFSALNVYVPGENVSGVKVIENSFSTAVTSVPFDGLDEPVSLGELLSLGEVLSELLESPPPHPERSNAATAVNARLAPVMCLPTLIADLQ
jgi:hypothetical protein